MPSFTPSPRTPSVMDHPPRTGHPPNWYDFLMPGFHCQGTPTVGRHVRMETCQLPGCTVADRGWRNRNMTRDCLMHECVHLIFHPSLVVDLSTKPTTVIWGLARCLCCSHTTPIFYYFSGNRSPSWKPPWWVVVKMKKYFRLSDIPGAASSS